MVATGQPVTDIEHELAEVATRLGFPVGQARLHGIGPDDPQPDVGLGLRRARAATLQMLALPGSAYLYQGEELGLPEHTTMPHEHRQDPARPRSGHTVVGRDGCRVPIPWEADAPSYGRVRPVELPAIELAATVHHGSHDDIDVTYGRLATWVHEHALAVAGPVQETYAVRPQDDPDPAAWRTGIAWPVFRVG